MLMTLLCLALLLFSAWYVPHALGELWGFKRVWPFQAAVFVLMAGYVWMLAKGAYASTNALAAAVYNVLGLFFIFQLYLFMFLLAAHIPAMLFK